jgi:RHS repeat-associated protein
MPQTRSKRQLRCQQRKTTLKWPVSPIKSACNPINTGASSYEKYSDLFFRNRLSSIDKTTSDTDLDGDFDQADFSQTSSQSSNLDAASNKLLGFSQTITKVRGTRTLATTNSSVNYALDANGNMTTDGLRSFDYDESNRLAKIKITKDGEAASITYLYNALGQRVFKGEPKLDTALPNESTLGATYIDWLKKNFQWLFTAAQANTSVGTAYSYADAGSTGLPEWALLGDYDNGSAKGAGRSEYIWLPTEDGSATPVGMFRNGRFFAVHADHLGTPRLVTNDTNTPVWQWPYSAFGSNKPTGILKATPNPRAALTNNPVLLRATGATEFNLRFPGQYADDEAGSFYNYFRSYDAKTGRYTQNDPIGLEGGLNRTGYVDGNPLIFSDPLGLQPYEGQVPPSNMPGGPWTPAGAGQAPGTFFGPQNSNGGPRDICRYVPDGANGGPSGAKDAYWKTQEAGQKGWSRFDSSGNSISPQQAHPSNNKSNSGIARSSGGGGGGGKRNLFDRNGMLYN